MITKMQSFSTLHFGTRAEMTWWRSILGAYGHIRPKTVRTPDPRHFGASAEVSRHLAPLWSSHIRLWTAGCFCLVNNSIRHSQLRKAGRPTCYIYYNIMVSHFGPYGWTVRYFGPKCLLDTSVLVPKCLDTSDLPEQCQSVSVPMCPGSVVMLNDANNSH